MMNWKNVEVKVVLCFKLLNAIRLEELRNITKVRQDSRDSNQVTPEYKSE
jgi:hypothetical protein